MRSSAIAEDLPTPFAGQYETILGSRGAAEIADAIETCLASGRSQRVDTYAAMKGTDAGGPMAVLIQRLVDATPLASFANPITGDRDQVVVSAVRGMGERLVGGATPDEWSVHGDDGRMPARAEHAINEDTVRMIATLARDVERIFGTPQDVEWAIAGGELWLLQARTDHCAPSRRHLRSRATATG